MTFLLGTNNQVKKKDHKQERKNTNATQSLNFGTVSKQLSFNDGNKEGYYQVRPKALMPSIHNPRPDWVINDDWLVRHVGINMQDVFENEFDSNCLVKLNEVEEKDKIIEVVDFPEFKNLYNSPDSSQKKEYEFLVSLATSIRETGQIQPIEIESDSENNKLVVLEGHLRRLACILGRIPYIKAIRNEGLQNLTKREKIDRQITENSIRSNISVYGNYKLACNELSENPRSTVREITSRLRIQNTLAASYMKLIKKPDDFHPLILEALQASLLSTRNLIKVVSFKRKDMQEQFIMKIINKNKVEAFSSKLETSKRGTTGAKKSVATFRIKSTENCIRAGRKLLRCMPELSEFSDIKEVKSVEDMVMLLNDLEKYLLETSDEVS